MAGKPDDLLQNKRGDPDDINLMFYSMLKEAKVDSDFILLATRNWQMLVPQFPSLTQFSRVILRLNFKDGAVYADAADPAAPFGEIPWFEKGVTGMTIKGNKLVPTPIPVGSPEENVTNTKYAMKVSADWSTEADVDLALSGGAAIDFRGDLIGQTPEKVDDRLTEYLGFGRGDAIVSNLTHPDLKDSSTAFAVKAHVKDHAAPDRDVSTLLLNPWIGAQFGTPLFSTKQRQSFVQFGNPEKRVITTTWELPDEIGVEKLPPEVKMQGDMADYSHSCVQEQKTVTCTRALVIKKTNMTDPTQFPPMKAFFDEVAQHDDEVLVLRKR